MKKIIVRGGNPLNGDVYISGMKNAALPIIFACILNRGKNVLYNVPDVSDIDLSLEILESLGAKHRRLADGALELDTEGVRSETAPYEFVSKMRGSTYLIGAMLGRFGEARVGLPGGCDFGDRPIDQHVKGFGALGAKVSFEDGSLRADAGNGLRGNSIYLDIASVGATANMMIAGVLANGLTVVMNAAREPHIVDLANFLNMCGADIRGAGTNTVKIRGVGGLHPCTYTISPDMIEAGTFMVAAATAGGSVNVRNIIPEHLDTITAKLRETGISVDVFDDYVTVSSDKRFRGVTIKTWPYPGFATDMHPQFSAMLCYASGVSTISDVIFDGRFKYVNELKKMGADISVSGYTASIMGGLPMRGAAMHATDLRAGAALVIAALAAKGVSEISGVEYIERGYSELDKKLRALGVDIEIVSLD
ncbi:MAG: UDP-N-acetylglucosamine 1-carboxyvinyltransferase [Ruminococcaceae bacterium]|nr:UDP-N-acetylglucosamine 1-carboxyvinyltransferase [Oscillospiraceae bacterium]